MGKENSFTILCALIAIIQMTSSASIDQASSPSSSSALFAADLLAQISKSKANENVVFSPLSIQTALAMTYLGAAGKTAEELKNSLRLPSSDKDKVGEYFSQILNKKAGDDGASLNIANRMYVSSDFQLKADFNKRAENYFNSGAEALNFKDLPSEAIKSINSWVEQKTNNKIIDLMKPGSVDNNTVAVIVNAIYFKGEWELPFSQDLTEKMPFWISNTESVDVDTMFGSDRNLKYGEFPELNATAIEMPYKGSDLSMMLILPNQKDGLADLEGKLAKVPINELSSQMKLRDDGGIDLMIPKFKIDFSTGLSGILKELGIRSMFEKADLPGIFESGHKVKVSDVQHKAFIDVNEAGSEAAAASFLEIMFHSINFKFIVNRPFFFAVKDSNIVYFAGHVVKL